jgi:hypothetical protein
MWKKFKSWDLQIHKTMEFSKYLKGSYFYPEIWCVKGKHRTTAQIFTAKSEKVTSHPTILDLSQKVEKW